MTLCDKYPIHAAIYHCSTVKVLRQLCLRFNVSVNAAIEVDDFCINGAAPQRMTMIQAFGERHGSKSDHPLFVGETPLHFATFYGASRDIIKLLLRHGANIYAAAGGLYDSIQTTTPLKNAMCWNYDALRVFVAHNIDDVFENETWINGLRQWPYQHQPLESTITTTLQKRRRLVITSTPLPSLLISMTLQPFLRSTP